MDTRARAPTRMLEEPTGGPPSTAPAQQVFATGDDAVTVKGNQKLQRVERHTRSLDYSLRALLAGGLAGCAVCQFSHARCVLD